MFHAEKKRMGADFLKGAALVFAALTFLRPHAAVEGALDGLALCAGQVIPALFPMMVLSQLLLASGLLALIAWPLRLYTGSLGIPGRAAGSAVALGWLGGFACGAQQIASLFRQNIITRRDAELLLCCTIGSGPAFVINAVGTLMLGSTSCGFALLAALLAANLITGWIMSRLLGRNDSAHGEPPAPQTPSFADAVRTSAQAMLSLCGFVVFFSFAVRVFFPAGAGWPAQWFASAALEVTNACQTAAQSGSGLRAFLCCASLSALGASVLFQIRSLLPSEIRLTPLVLSRLIHLPVSLALFALLLRLFPSALPASAPARLWMPVDAATAVFLMLCVVLFSFPRLRRSQNRV